MIAARRDHHRRDNEPVHPSSLRDRSRERCEDSVDPAIPRRFARLRARWSLYDRTMLLDLLRGPRTDLARLPFDMFDGLEPGYSSAATYTVSPPPTSAR